ncbi:MAG: Zn-ribbon domain-containing OB-fold protein [Thermodesulfobacteriota bacterium]|nr:Zn-ribbon domain-containing OB-fold protein [Thermodesulfobacteriota bacterium]
MTEKKEFLSIGSGEAEQPFNWSIGKHGSKFLTEIRDNKKIFGVRCPKCGKVYTPIRKVCGDCFVPMEELVELSGKGSVYMFTVLSFGFVNPETGEQRPVPYTYAFIQLDGADNRFVHFLEESDVNKIRIGMRVEVVFEEERKGNMLDIKHFRTIED